MKFEWVVVLNPNRNETTANMNFQDAYQKESWFFDELFAPIGEPWPPIMEGTPPDEPEPEPSGGTSDFSPQPEPEPAGSADENPRRLCGIDGFRSVLVGKYAAFATAHCMTMAPMVFGMVLQEQQDLFNAWGWTAEEEHYDDKQRLIGVLQKSIRELLNEGNTFNAGNVLATNKKIFDGALGRSRPEQTENDLKRPIDLLLSDMIDRATKSAKKNKFMRFPCLMTDLLEACKVMKGLSKAEFETKITDEIASANQLIKDSKADSKTVCVPHLVFSAQRDLVELTKRITELPKLPLAILSDSPAQQLAHAKLTGVVHAKDERGRFGLKIKDGKVSTGSTEPCPFPVGAVIVQCMGLPLDQKNVAKAIQALTQAVPNGSPVPFSYVKSASLIDDSNLDLADWLLPININQQYRVLRDELMRHRRAAELLRLVFDEDTASQSDRKTFDTSDASSRPLLRLAGYMGVYSGELLAKPTFADKVAESLPKTDNITQEDLLGLCCTPGCFRPIDAACHPCGRTLTSNLPLLVTLAGILTRSVVIPDAVCCWDCLNEIKLHPTGEADAQVHKNDGCCPVCDVTMTGTYLCWEPTVPAPE